MQRPPARRYGAHMRPIPAPRLGDAHGLLRAIASRERIRLDEFVTDFEVEELFPPGLENALGRTRQFVSYARLAGLLTEDRGMLELTDMGKRYVRAGDAREAFDVAPAQAEWLRRLLRERHLTDSIYHGAAVALSLYSSNPPDFRVVHARLRPRARAPRPRGVGQREHVRVAGPALHAVPAGHGADRRRAAADADRAVHAQRPHARDPHVAQGPRGAAQPRRAGGRGARRRGRVRRAGPCPDARRAGARGGAGRAGARAGARAGRRG